MGIEIEHLAALSDLKKRHAEELTAYCRSKDIALRELLKRITEVERERDAACADAVAAQHISRLSSREWRQLRARLVAYAAGEPVGVTQLMEKAWNEGALHVYKSMIDDPGVYVLHPDYASDNPYCVTEREGGG